MATSTIAKQNWLLSTIRRKGPITLKELNELWTDKNNDVLNPEHKELQYRTLRRHIEFIEDFYGISIKCDQGFNEYYVDDGSEGENDKVKNWLLDTIAIDNLLSEKRSLKERIQMEDIPSGREYLQTIIEAMKDEFKLKMTYFSFWDNEERTILLEPYFIKVFKQRWYVIGPSDYHPDDPHIYALDRVWELQPTSFPFDYPESFDPKEFFNDSFGIFHSDGEPYNIEIKVKGRQQDYIESLPLHHSQYLIEKNEEEDYSVYGFKMRPDFDLIQEIAAKGDAYEVLAPEEFRYEIADFLKRASKQYE